MKPCGMNLEKIIMRIERGFCEDSLDTTIFIKSSKQLWSREIKKRSFATKPEFRHNYNDKTWAFGTQNRVLKLDLKWSHVFLVSVFASDDLFFFCDLIYHSMRNQNRLELVLQNSILEKKLTIISFIINLYKKNTF